MCGSGKTSALLFRTEGTTAREVLMWYQREKVLFFLGRMGFLAYVGRYDPVLILHRFPYDAWISEHRNSLAA